MAKEIGKKLASEINVIRTGLESGIYNNEAAVCRGIVDTLLQRLGWRTNDTTVVCPEYAIADGRVDYALCHPPRTPRVLIEVKRVGNIAGAEEQLFSYAPRQDIPILILTDGRLWRFFNPSGTGTYNDRLVCELDLSDTDSNKIAYQFERYLSYTAICDGVAVDAIADDHRKLTSKKNDVPPPTPDPRPHGSTPRRERYTAYFQALIDELQEHNFTKMRRPGTSSFYRFASGFSGVSYTARFTRERTVQTYLLIRFGDAETTNNFFDALKERESEINANFEVPLYWSRHDDLKTSRIYIQRDGDIDSSERELEAFRAWHVENLLKFKEVFTPEIQLALEKQKSNERERQ